LSGVTVEQASEAHAIHPVAAIQSELSLWSRDPMGSGEGDDVMAWCRQHGAAFVPFSPLGRGFLTGALDASTTFEQSDFRARLPRFTTAARAANERIVALVRDVASLHNATPAQVALAWVLAQGEQVIPIPGTRRQQHLRANLEAADLVLTRDELARLDNAPMAVGTRY
jgi:aryl-alcohol dehydrogenase-like predicted oxidoreductase